MKNVRFLAATVVMGSLVWACDTETPVEPDSTETLFDTTQVLDEDGALAYEIITIDDQGEGTGNLTLTNDFVWVLDGFVFVNDGQTLTIEAGTVVKGKSGQGENASALIVARGGMIDAAGTAQSPIIFTSETDAILPSDIAAGNVEGSLPTTVRGLWGGVIVLGNATNNNTTSSKFIEGLPATDTRSQYGGTDDADNSGTMTYVSIRHGGTDIGNGNEINGLTLGSVGNGTTLDYIEVIANKDDGIEWFGGSVNVKHALIANCGDDSFDYDEGWHGNVQFAFVIQEGAGDRAGEHDGGPSDNETGTPYAIPTFANFTYVGQGLGAGTNAIELRDNAGGYFYNGIIVGFDGGIDIEDLAGDGGDSYKQWQDGNLNIAGVQFFNVDDNFVEGDADTDFDMTAEFDNLTEQDPSFSAAYVAGNRAVGVATPAGAFFDSADGVGAFVNGAWHAGWTLWAAAAGL